MRETPAAWVDFDQIAWVSITLSPELATTMHRGHADAHPVLARSAEAQADALLAHAVWLQTTSAFLAEHDRAEKIEIARISAAKGWLT